MNTIARPNRSAAAITSASFTDPPGWMMAAAVLLQIPYRTLCLKTGRSLRSFAASTFAYTLIAALVLNWLALLLRR